MPKTASFKIKVLSKEKKGWKLKKSKEPDVGSYDVAKSITAV